ncbi:M16 family metallopeptidase [Undibacterium sp. Ji49W]|uniref:M16 family metallopeptidase n=1 Tax=Undibacterium sp. Ji49W TaxID=3413040 RepID=UPI003BF2D98D
MTALNTTLTSFALAISLLVSHAPVHAAATLPVNVTQASSVEGITEYRLPNGFKVLLMPDNSQATITVNMIYMVGSRHENIGQTGYAHLLEHMLCRGSKSYPQIASQLSNRGVRWNAFTRLDYTNYIGSFEANEADLDWVLGMEADRMQNAQVLQTELDTEMTVVRNELELREVSPSEILSKRLLAVAFDWHGYGHSTGGEKSDIEKVNIEQLRQLYHTYYRPDNAVLVVAGKFDAAHALEVIARKFSHLVTPKTALPVIPTVEPAQQGERQVIVRRKSSYNVTMLAYHKPSALHPDYAALKVAGGMLSSGREQRNKDNEIILSNFSPAFAMQGNTDAGLAVFTTDNYAGAPSDENAKGLAKIIEGFGQQNLSQDELDFVKSQYVNNFSRLMNDAEKMGTALSDYISLGDWRLLFVEKDRIAKLTTTQVQNAAKRYFVRENRTVGVLLADEKSPDTSIPPAPPLSEVMKNFSHTNEYALVSDFNASVANIQKQTRRLKIGNLDVALLSKPSRGQAVSVDLALHWGDEQSLFAKRWLERMTDQTMLNGSGQFGKEALEAEREKSHIRGGLTQFTTDRAHLKQALQLMVINLKEPSFAQAQTVIDKEKRKWFAERGNPVQMGMDEMARHFNAYPDGDIRAQETAQQIISELNAIKATDLFDFHKQFYGASNGHLAIVGDFDVDEAATVLRQQFAEWESKTPYQHAKTSIIERLPLDTFIPTPGKDNGYFMGRIDLAISQNDPDYAALEVANYLIGGSTAESRLGLRVRQKEGWSYHVRSRIEAQMNDPAASWQIIATAASANVDKLKAAIIEELRTVESAGFRPEELAKAKQVLGRLAQQQRADDTRIASLWNTALHQGKEFSLYAQREAAIQNLTLEQLNQVSRKYLQPNLWSIVTTGDPKKMNQKP